MTLDRFVEAQELVIDQVMAELKAGEKQTHWMWFIFPQLKALGQSDTAKFYGLADLSEARQYLYHPVLGARLVACTRAVLHHADKTAHEIFGSPDDLKFRSCMTLFMIASSGQVVFSQALAAFFDAKPDPKTVELLRILSDR